MADVKQRANFFMNKLCDRDTEAMAAAELESMALSLQPDSISSFISAITDTRSSDKTPLRRHCLKLLSLLSRSYPPESLSPFYPRMVSSILRRLRDQDSSIRAACVVAATSLCHVIIKPLSEALILEQDQNAQTGSALCLAAAIEEIGTGGGDDHVAAHLRRLIPRLMKLARSESYRSKPALLSLLGTIVAANGASTSPLLSQLVPCLADSLVSEDWAVRKSAAEALTQVASIPSRHLLTSFKLSYFSFFQSRKFDKVKIVRESMTQMLEAWREVPGAINDDDDRGNEIEARRSSTGRSSPFPARKERSPASKSPATDSSRKKISPRERRTLFPLCRSNTGRSPPEWKIEVTVPRAQASAPQEEEEEREIGRKLVFEKIGVSKSGSKIVPVQEKGASLDVEETHEEKDGDLSQIRKQLVQIENQQSDLLDLVQRFIGNSQTGMRSLETRVSGLEVALDEISHDLSVPSGRVDHCCRIPMADLLSPKFWRRTENKCSAQVLGPTSKDVLSKSNPGPSVNLSSTMVKGQPGTEGFSK